jgi:hypothetical protein
MITIAITLITSFFFTIKGKKFNSITLKLLSKKIFIGIIVGFLISILIPVQTEESRNTYKLLNMKIEKKMISKSIFGCNFNDNDLIINFIYKNAAGDIKISQIKTSNAIIRFNKQPEVEKVRKELTSSLLNLFSTQYLFFDYSKEIFVFYIERYSINDEIYLEI